MLSTVDFRIYLLVVGRGLGPKAIAEELGLSVGAIHAHLKAIFDEMGVSNCLGLLVQFYRRELLVGGEDGRGRALLVRSVRGIPLRSGCRCACHRVSAVEDSARGGLSNA